MKLHDLLVRTRQLIRDVVYPEGAVCQGCGKISDGEYLCAGCRKELRYGDMLEAWALRDLQGVTAWSMRLHRGLPRKLVLLLKYNAEARAASELAGMLQDRPAFFPDLPPETVVTWVPAPKVRIRERCIDHGRLLAEAVSRELGLSCRQLMNRKGNDTPQAGLKEKKRRANLKHAFVPREEIAFPVLLVDDVLTTGTTALRCIAALRKAGAENITVLTATRAL